MYITLYYIVTRLPDSLRVVKDHFLSVCPTTLTVELLEKALLAAEKSIVAIGASRGDPRTPIFEGCSPSPLLPSVASAAAADLVGLESVAGAVEEAVEAEEGVGVAVGVVAGVEVSVAAVEAEAVAAVAVGAEVAEVAEVAAVEEAAEEEAAAAEAVLVRVVLHRGSAQVVVSANSSSRSSALVTLPHLSSSMSATLHASGVGVQVGAPTSSAQATARGGSSYLDVILAAMYAVSISDEGDCYWCYPPDPGIETAALGTGEAAALGAREAAALGASASAYSGSGESALSGTASASVSLTFTLDSRASRSFIRNRTTLTPLGRPVAVSLADPSGGPVLSHFSTVLPCLAAPSSTLSGLYLPSFSTNLVSGADLQDAGVHQPPVSLSLVFPGPSLPFLRGLALPASPVSRGGCGLPLTPPRFLRQRPRCRTLHMDVWGLARVRGQGHERYFVLVVDDFLRYTTVFPLRSKGDVAKVLIDWIRAARLLLRRSFGLDFPVLRLHSDRGGEFSSGLLRAYCSARGIRQTFTLPDSPQQNGIAERRIGMVMDVARTSIMHAAAPHFLWPFAVQYAAHQINLHPRVSMPETSPALLWTGKVGDASAFRVWGSRVFVRDLSADKLSPHAAP
ncbi:unnamed protein product [Closterium sp. NIES-64]|nr:unnamed protein product [Closterium sp. NIES-64]